MIRAFKENDIKEIAAIWLESNLDAHSFIAREYWTSALPLVEKAISEAEVYVCENDADGRIDAFIGLNGDYVEGLFVRKERRSIGLGRALLDRVKSARPSLRLKVYLKNERATRFYLREGFVRENVKLDPATKEEEVRLIWSRTQAFDD